MPRIEKGPKEEQAYRRGFVVFPRARDAFRSLLLECGVPERGAILLPSYIGWSPKEGSGVFDPVRELNARFGFYRVDREARIDLDDLNTQLHRLRPRVLLLIHYFGYPDPASREAANAARRLGCFVVEDEAHSMLSDLVGGRCGRDADAAIFSLHKLLPLRSGGVLVRNRPTDCAVRRSRKASRGLSADADLGAFDLAAISAVRVRNAQFLAKELRPLSRDLDLLRPETPPGVVPQTMPVILKRAPRDAVYEEMNESGYGVVSLYHTMIAEISATKYPDAHWLSRRILNLPVHQDASIEALAALVSQLRKCLSRNRTATAGVSGRREKPMNTAATGTDPKRRADRRRKRTTVRTRAARGRGADEAGSPATKRRPG